MTLDELQADKLLRKMTNTHRFGCRNRREISILINLHRIIRRGLKMSALSDTLLSRMFSKCPFEEIQGSERGVDSRDR